MRKRAAALCREQARRRPARETSDEREKARSAGSNGGAGKSRETPEKSRILL